MTNIDNLDNSIDEILRSYFSKVINRASEQHGDTIVTFANKKAEFQAEAKAAIKQLVLDEVSKVAARRSHLKRDDYQTFCGWGLLDPVGVVELPEDATCKTCIRLQLLKDRKSK